MAVRDRQLLVLVGPIYPWNMPNGVFLSPARLPDAGYRSGGDLRRCHGAGDSPYSKLSTPDPVTQLRRLTDAVLDAGN